MMRQTTISNQQMMALLVISTVGTASLYAPAILTQYASRDSWVLVLLGGVVGILNVLVFLQLNKWYPGKSIIAISRQVLGGWLGGLFSFLFFFYFLDITSWVLREYAQFFIIALNPMIPQNGYMIVGIIMCAYAVFHGLEVIARVALLILGISVMTFLFIYILLVSQYHFEYLLPVMENGFWSSFKGSFVVISWFGDMMFISMIIQYVKRTKKTVPYAIIGIGISFALLMMAVVGCIVVFGGKGASTFTYPIVSLIQNIKLFRDIERLDAILIAIWVMSSFVKVTVYFWSALQALTEWLHISRPRLFIPPLAVAVVICARFKIWGLIEMSSLYDRQAWYFLIFQLVLPIVLFLVAAARQNSIPEEKSYGSG
ncbi:GerAB/ArcD/ProY family transporter [Paenibacillus radicis (ex Gao et al. 2016)]|uniref:Germination protein n=1 Tax=Paenibacillus radicis (ex Gao et al. 2016) TaxID=1737354 RepID=A0A917M5K7_9BACL|nr:endospore germination permease [Paenibacillus radicis (ex Gao et al. 2016)]GGG79484.1 germination protein [Paenibacillus radicis (ex Gao et al. 2016)]